MSQSNTDLLKMSSYHDLMMILTTGSLPAQATKLVQNSVILNKDMLSLSLFFHLQTKVFQD